ncbi:MAG: DEAD/DEAH box helicase family protein [Bacteroidales bacterium]|jgi:superfamily II DNA or RNA helicase|nr:DEAD/DEAH box helicase family protein [Bacteroidales bacterium]
MNNNSNIHLSDYTNPLATKDTVSLKEYLETYKSRITQESETLFVQDFLYPLFGEKFIKYVVPQFPFIDSEGRARRIDFGILYDSRKIALEVNGETYHAEGIIPHENFDDNLNRQNEILNAGWFLLRFSYSQLQSPQWRNKVANDLFSLLRKRIPELISETVIEPNYLQKEVLETLDYYRSKGWKKGVVVLPTGTGKTFLSAFDTLKAKGRTLFIVHRLDILSQSKEAFEKIYPNEKLGLLTGEAKENVEDSKVLFASKDTLRNPEILQSFKQNEFDYIIVDEVHHGQAPSYKYVLQYFNPNFFMLGLTATPDRMDRKDIFELFDYQKIYEYTLNEVIENGFLVPYTYYGLMDNIDYNNIRYNGKKYNVADLDRTLIINERNEKIFEEYVSKGNGNKALGFCCSIKHANAMAKFFNKKGIPAIAITSETENREQVIKNFRNSKYTVAFTVDLFNEGIDFPDLQVLLFLRPTESKTVFFQQLGRGLRLCGGKNKVVIIDFIGNYKKANNLRKYLSKGSTERVNPLNGRVEKSEYQYTPNCEVIFETEVEEILDRQDTAEREITKEDLIDTYYTLSEQLNRKPSQEDINREGEFKVSRYLSAFNSWVAFLKEIGEHTEASYHFPQGTHLGHIMYILDVIGNNKIKDSHIDPQYVRFSGGYDEYLGEFQRQTKYKLQAAMEMGLLVDFRKEIEGNFSLIFTNKGEQVYNALKGVLSSIDFSFSTTGKTDISWAMTCESTINQTIKNYLCQHPEEQTIVRKVLLEMDAVNLLLKYLYAIQRKTIIEKSDIYADFFNAPFVKQYLDRHGIEQPTEEGRRRRIPFLFNILEALGIINQKAREIEVLTFVPAKEVMRLSDKEINDIINKRILLFTGKKSLPSNEVSQLKELYGMDFLTKKYYLPISNF